MALWGNNDNVNTIGTVSLNYSTRVVTGAGGADFTSDGMSEGDVIRFGDRANGTYYGDAVVVTITDATTLTIGSTAGLSGDAIAGVGYSVSQLPKYTVLDSKYSEASYGTEDSYVYGISTAGGAAAQNTSYAISHAGYVGVLTYMDNHGNLRVKAETLVALSGIQTGNAPIYDGNPLV